MQIFVNGTPSEVPSGTTVAQILSGHDLEARRVAVELNARLVQRNRLGETQLSAGDALEIVTLVGGG